MLHFTLSQIVQMRLPMSVLFEIFGDMFGQQDVTGVAAVHYSLRHVDSSPGDIRPLVDINNSADRTAVYAHAQPQFWMFLERPADLERATGASGLCHAVAGRNFY